MSRLAGVERSFPSSIFLAGLFWLATLLVRLQLIVAARFDGLYGQDAYAYFNYAAGPLREALLAFQGPPPFTWPPGYPLLVSLATFLTGVEPGAGQLVSLIAAASLPISAAALAWEVWGRERRSTFVPVVTAIIVSAAGQLWQSSVVVMSDTAALAFATMGVWALARYGRPAELEKKAGGAGWLLLAAASLAFAILTRWGMALVAIPATLYALIALIRRPARLAFLQASVATMVTIAILSPVLPSIWAVLLGSAGEPDFVVDLLVYRWNPANAWRRSFETSDGFLNYRLPNGLYYGLAPARRYLLTPLLAIFVLPGLWRLLRERTALSLILVAGWIASVYLFLAGAAWQNFRFALMFLPPLALLAAIGLERTIGRQRPSRRWLIWLILVFGLLASAQGGWRLTTDFIERKEADLATLTWVEAQTEGDARLLVFDLTLTFQQYSRRESLELFYLDPASLEALLKGQQPSYLLLNVSQAESQWRGRPPELNYHWLRDGPGLVELGSDRGFSLFRIGLEGQ
jgi:4-amino-4-deoxy-L-arabinose transferase-like glycosyltransferase